MTYFVLNERKISDDVTQSVKNLHCLVKSRGEKSVEQMENVPQYVPDAFSENICCKYDQAYGSKYKSTQHVSDQNWVH